MTLLPLQGVPRLSPKGQQQVTPLHRVLDPELKKESKENQNMISLLIYISTWNRFFFF